MERIDYWCNICLKFFWRPTCNTCSSPSKKITFRYDPFTEALFKRGKEVVEELFRDKYYCIEPVTYYALCDNCEECVIAIQDSPIGHVSCIECRLPALLSNDGLVVDFAELLEQWKEDIGDDDE